MNNRGYYFVRSVLLAIIFVPMGTQVYAQAGATTPPPEGVTTKEVHFYSEGVQCYGKLFLPKGYSPEGKMAAVVLAPGWENTETSIESYATRFAARGLVAMAIDYRGWGKSGGYVYLAEQVRFDDRLRFSQHTAKVRIRRKRLIPTDQVLDIRNAISYLQGELGIDRNRIGVWGTDIAGGHVAMVAATDPRIRAAVAQTPIIGGKDKSKRPTLPSSERLKEQIALARYGQAPGTQSAAALMTGQETRSVFAEYHPFWYVEQIPQNVAVLFVVAERDSAVDNETNALAVAKQLQGPVKIAVMPSATHMLSGPSAEMAAEHAAEWFLKYL